MKLSACIIAKNEEATISRCINSFKQFIHEIILVDTGSTDDTASKAKALGAKIFHYKWQNNFSSARNFAIKHAVGDWIIFLDADEYFIDNTGSNILKIIEAVKLNDNIDAIFCEMKHIDQVTGNFLGADPVIRIFRNIKQLKYVGSIHEKLEKASGKLNYFVPNENKIILYHTGYSPERKQEKALRNLALLKADIENGRATELTYYYMSDCYVGLEQYKDALDYANRFIEAKFDVPGFNCHPYVTKIKLMFIFKEQFSLDQIYIVIQEALKKFPNFPEFHKFLAQYYLENRKYSSALKQFLITLEINERYDGFDGNTLPTSLDEIYSSIAFLYIMKNEYISSLEYSVKALQCNRLLESAFNNMLLVVKDQAPEDIIFLLNSIYKKDSEQDIKFVMEQLIKWKFKGVILYYSNIWRKEFGHEDISQLIVLLSQGQYNDAFEHFRKCFLNNPTPQWELFMVVSALLSNDRLLMEEIMDIVQETYRKVLEAYSPSKNSIVEFEDIEADLYMQLLEEIVLIGNNTQVKYVLALSKFFMLDISERIGQLMIRLSQYQQFIEFFYNSADSSQNSSVVYLVAFCFYKLDQYTEALKLFTRAIELGYQNHDVLEIIGWVREKIV